MALIAQLHFQVKRHLLTERMSARRSEDRETLKSVQQVGNGTDTRARANSNVIYCSFQYVLHCLKRKELLNLLLRTFELKESHMNSEFIRGFDDRLRIHNRLL